MFVPKTGITGLEWLHDGPPYGKPPGWGWLGAAEGRPACFEHHPSACTCLHDHPMALVYVRRRVADVDDREIARRHRDRCNQTVEHLDARTIGWYLDHGSSEAPQRPGLDALLERLTVITAKQQLWHTRPVEYVVASQADQLARRVPTWQRINAAITASGARFVLASEVLA